MTSDPAPDVAPDGSPVAVYAVLPTEPDLGLVRSVLRPGATVLDLGAGVGRIANPLAADGHEVVAVDDSPAMLAELAGPEPVQADIWTLDLGRRFDVVLALSHLVDARPRARRVQLLRMCRKHLHDDGLLIVQRYPPGWIPRAGENAIGELGIRLHDVVMLDDGFAAKVTYSIGERAWTQEFDAALVDDEELHALAAETDLVVQARLDDAGAWVVLAPR